MECVLSSTCKFHKWIIGTYLFNATIYALPSNLKANIVPFLDTDFLDERLLPFVERDNPGLACPQYAYVKNNKMSTKYVTAVLCLLKYDVK